jgi:hypothetical protein
MLDLTRPRGEAEARFRRVEIRTVRRVVDGTGVLHTVCSPPMGIGDVGSAVVRRRGRRRSRPPNARTPLVDRGTEVSTEASNGALKSIRLWEPSSSARGRQRLAGRSGGLPVPDCRPFPSAATLSRLCGHTLHSKSRRATDRRSRRNARRGAAVDHAIVAGGPTTHQELRDLLHLAAAGETGARIRGQRGAASGGRLGRRYPVIAARSSD